MKTGMVYPGFEKLLSVKNLEWVSVGNNVSIPMFYALQDNNKYYYEVFFDRQLLKLWKDGENNSYPIN